LTTELDNANILLSRNSSIRKEENLSSKRLSKDEREKQIQNAAKKVILEKGFFNTTMDDVIVCSGMSVGGVYHYYKSIYEIFYDIMSQGLDYGEERNFLKTGEKHNLDRCRCQFALVLDMENKWEEMNRIVARYM